jgi:hypothetical protein
MFLEAVYGVKVRLVNPDGNDEIEIQEYNTGSKMTVKELEKEMQKHGARFGLVLRDHKLFNFRFG